nr:MAG TPA: hypothetical protein [Caudoviricetes sp.]
MKLTGWAWDHAKNVIDRNENRFETRGDLEQYLLSAYWTPDEVSQMLAYLDRNRKEAKA